MAGIKIVHVPYKGAAPASTDLIGGHIDAAFPGITLALPLIKSGKIRPIGVASLKRSDNLPDVPTLSEAGLKGFEVLSWYGLLAPAKTPQNIISLLNQEVIRATNDPDGVERLKTMGAEPSKMTPAELTSFIKGELTKWTKVVEFAGAKAAE
jgi:tripartite-type tricarboxylate transporter receptor subunit TctC